MGTEQKFNLPSAAERAEMNEAAKSGMSLADYRKQNYLIEQAKKNRQSDLEEGRKRGEELFGAGALSDIEGRRAKEVADIVAARKAQAEGLTPEEKTALYDQATQGIKKQSGAALRQLRGIQGASGVRGATAGAQQAKLLADANAAQTGAKRDIFLKGMEAKRSGLDALERSVMGARAEELGTLGREKFGQQATELGYAGLGAGERSAISQRLIGEQMAARSGGGGKK